MAKVYKVASPTLALKLANKFKQQGIYDLFRGQNEDWPLVASIKRLSIKKQEDAIDRLWRFKLFLSEYKVTKKYGDDLNHLSAIAQHYGIPTDLLDFTKSPEIALFFATHSKKDLTGKNGVIICLNQQDFEECIKIQEGYIKP